MDSAKKCGERRQRNWREDREIIVEKMPESGLCESWMFGECFGGGFVGIGGILGGEKWIGS
jgi:hypothetical protein